MLNSSVQTNSSPDDTRSPLPHVSGEERVARHRHRLINAFNTGRLLKRVVFFNHWDEQGHPLPSAPASMKRLERYKITPSGDAADAAKLRTSEPEYQSKPKQPRPVSSIIPGVYTDCFPVASWHYDMQFALINTDAMTFYKWDAFTNTNKGRYPPWRQLFSQTFKTSHSYEDHIAKRREMARRWGSLYPNLCEGHFDATGRHTGFRTKEQSATAKLLNSVVPWMAKPNDLFREHYVPWDEITTTGYRPKDYEAIVASPVNMLSPWQPLYWVDFYEKHHSEHQPLPLVLYNQDRRALSVNYYEDCPDLFNGNYAEAVIQLNRLMRLFDIRQEVLGKLLFKLPASEAINLLLALKDDLQKLADHLSTPEAQCFLGLQFGRKNIRDLKALISRVNDPNCTFTGGKNSRLLSLIFDRFAAPGIKKGDSRELTFRDLRDRPSETRLMTSGWILGRKLIERGLDAASTDLTNEQILKNPLLATELYIAGATLPNPGQTLLPMLAGQLYSSDQKALVANVFNRLLAHLDSTHQTDEIQSAITQVKKMLHDYDPSETQSAGMVLGTLGDAVDKLKQKSGEMAEITHKTLLENDCDAICSLLEKALNHPVTVKHLSLRPGAVPNTTSECHITQLAPFLANAIAIKHQQQPLNLRGIDDLEGNGQKILERYYLMPSKDQIEQSLQSNTVCRVYRNFHGADHASRTAINVEWLTELFTRHGIDKGHLCPKACQLLQYAAFYHDVDAEVGDKDQEEINAAKAMANDLRSLLPEADQPLLQDVVSALRNKNVNDMEGELKAPFTPDKPETRERLFRQILRMADSIEITRCLSVNDRFAEKPESRAFFSLQYSDAPDAFTTNPIFREELVTGVDNMMDLGFMTGGRSDNDARKSGSHGFRFGLRDSRFGNTKRQQVMNLDQNIYQRIKHEQALLIARRLAAELKLHIFCDNIDGTDVDVMPVIRNDLGLDQFMNLIQPLIDPMTPLQRQTFSRPENLAPLIAEARKRVPAGWQPELPLGTLSQIDLQYSVELRGELKRRGLKVIEKTFPLPDGPHTVLRLAPLNAEEPEAPLISEANALQKKRALTDQRARLEKAVRERAKKD